MVNADVGLPPSSGKFFYSEYKEMNNIYYMQLGISDKNIKQNLVMSSQEEKLGLMTEACKESYTIGPD